MTVIKATANWEKDDEKFSGELEVEYEFGGDALAMINELGADVVYRHAISSITVALQGQMRQWIQQGLSEDEIKGEGGKLDQWSPPSGKPRAANRMAKITALMEKMSQEERELLMASLTE